MTEKFCNICAAGGIWTREPIEKMTEIEYDAIRDGLNQIGPVYACEVCIVEMPDNTPACAICAYNGQEVRQTKFSMLRIAYEPSRDGLGREGEDFFACNDCAFKYRPPAPGDKQWGGGKQWGDVSALLDGSKETPDMPDAIYTLNELADLVDITTRTIRNYIQQDLLRGPDSMGRNARYSDYHRKRLEAIKALRDDYALPLDEIRRLVNLSDIDEDITLAALPLPPRLEETDTSTALDFIRARQAQGYQQRRVRQQPQDTESLPEVSAHMMQSPDLSHSMPDEEPPSEGSKTSTGPIELLLQHLQSLTGDQRVSRRARGEEWFRLSVTPDLEFHVRGELTREQISLFEQLADHFRHILLGGK